VRSGTVLGEEKATRKRAGTEKARGRSEVISCVNCASKAPWNKNLEEGS